MTLNRIKVLAIVILLLPMLAIVVFKTEPIRAGSYAVDDAAADFKAKCAACHSPKAEKFFDPTKADADLIQTVLKGKKGEKPPYMPAFEAKGITEDQAKALVGYMKGLRAPAQR